MKIYAVDDEKLMLEALIDTIENVVPQAKVIGFRKVQDFIDAFKEEVCDIIFLDINMPVMDGVILTKKILDIKEDTDIIFVTGYDEYKADAMYLNASAYIMKPATTKKIEEALRHLRFPVETSNDNSNYHAQSDNRYRAITFGNFTLYIDGKPVHFHRKKSQELLAYLVAKGGTVVSRSELTLVLLEDESHSEKSRKNLDNAIRTLRTDLQEIGASDILCRGSNGLAVNREILSADLFDFLEGNKNLYHGQFMENYSWSETFKNIFI